MLRPDGVLFKMEVEDGSEEEVDGDQESESDDEE